MPICAARGWQKEAPIGEPLEVFKEGCRLFERLELCRRPVEAGVREIFDVSRVAQRRDLRGERYLAQPAYPDERALAALCGEVGA